MTALSDALTAAQRSALAALEKAYVAEKIDKEELSRQISLIGLTDTVDGDFLLAALDVLKDWGVAAPNMAERIIRENGEPEKASDKQRALIADLCRRKQLSAPDLAGLTKPKASELVADDAAEAFRWGDGDGMSYYEPSIHVTEQGDIGIAVGGTVFVRSVEEWHRLAGENAEYEEIADAMLDALLLIRDNEHGESYSAGVAMSCIASLDERRQAYERGKVPRFLPKWLGGEADRVSGPGARLPDEEAS
jgi:hypothetical protein